MKKIVDRESLEEMMKLWKKEEQGIRQLFNNIGLVDQRYFLKVKLKYFDEVYQNSKGISPDGRTARKELKTEIDKLEKELHPSAVFRIVGRMDRLVGHAGEKFTQMVYSSFGEKKADDLIKSSPSDTLRKAINGGGARENGHQHNDGLQDEKLKHSPFGISRNGDSSSHQEMKRLFDRRTIGKNEGGRNLPDSGLTGEKDEGRHKQKPSL